MPSQTGIRKRRKNKYVPHLAEFFFRPTENWSRRKAQQMFDTRFASSDVPLDTVFYEDCVSAMRRLADESIDLVIADPPFGIKFDGKAGAYNRQDSLVIDGYNEIAGDYEAFTRSWIGELHRLMKDHASAYIFSGWNNLQMVEKVLQDCSLYTVNHIVWKYNFGLFTRRKFVTSHYHILLVVKDLDRYYFNKVEHYPQDVWLIDREYRPGERKNGNKLPTALIKECMRFSSRPGDVVLDPFIGNGTTAAVAHAMWRHYIGFEINIGLRKVIESEIERYGIGDEYKPFDRTEHIRQLSVDYPRVAEIYREMTRQNGKSGALTTR